MTVTITYTGATPTIDADEDTWGAELNTDALAPIKADLDALAVQGNATETLAGDALPKAGGTLTGDVILADVGPTSIQSVGFRGLPVISINADRTFALTDAGKMIRLTGSTNRTWTIPANGTVGFPIGTVIVLRTASTGTVLVSRASGVELRTNGSSSNLNKTIPAFTEAVIKQEAANVWLITGVA